MGARITVRRSWAAGLARFCGALSIPVLVLTALGQHVALFPDFAVLSLITTGIALALIGFTFGLIALIAIWNNGELGAGSSILAMVYSLPGVALFAVSMHALTVYPQLNDISTDLLSPPEFLVLEDGVERIETATAEQRDTQLAAYPDITSRLFPVPIERVFEAVHILADKHGWRIVRQTIPTELERSATIQMVARTPLFRFSDHLAVRIVGETGGTRVDIRSASVVGRHDLGQNARRIRTLLGELDEAMQGERRDLQPAGL